MRERNDRMVHGMLAMCRRLEVACPLGFLVTRHEPEENMSRSKQVILTLILALLQACSSPGQPPVAQEIAQSDLHAIMTDRISDSIDRMDTLLHDQIRTETELDQDRRRNAAKIAIAAGELQQSVDMILALQPKLPLNKDEAPEFIALASQLKHQAATLQDLAQHNRIDGLRPAVERVKTTCNTCHKLFRGY